MTVLFSTEIANDSVQYRQTFMKQSPLKIRKTCRHVGYTVLKKNRWKFSISESGTIGRVKIMVLNSNLLFLE